EAESLQVRALEICRRESGEDHPLTLVIMNNLATFYWSTRKLERSIPLFEELLKRRQATLGPDHPSTLHTMANLGSNYATAGRLPEAIALLEQAWAKALKLPDPLVMILAWIPGTLGDAYERAGQFEKAESLYREALETARQRHKEVFISIDLQFCLARDLFRWQGCPEAEPLLRECLKFREQNEANNWETFFTKSALGVCLLGQKRYAEAEPLLLAGYEGMKRREGTIPPIRKNQQLTPAI